MLSFEGGGDIKDVELDQVKLSYLAHVWILVASSLKQANSSLASYIRLKSKRELVTELSMMIASAKFSLRSEKRTRMPKVLENLHEAVTNAFGECGHYIDCQHPRDENLADDGLANELGDLQMHPPDETEIANVVEPHSASLSKDEASRIAEECKNQFGFYKRKRVIFKKWKEHGFSDEDCVYYKRHLENERAKRTEIDNDPLQLPQEPEDQLERSLEETSHLHNEVQAEDPESNTSCVRQQQQ